MTKSKRTFAAMLVDAQGFGDVDEIAKMSLVDIIYELKKAEEPPPVVVAPPPCKVRDFWSRLTHDSDDD